MLKAFTTAIIEEFTVDLIYDERRDSILAVIDEEHKLEVHRILARMKYDLILSRYNDSLGTYTVVYSRY